MGAGSNPEKGQRAAEESRDEIAAALKGTNMVFITAGMGGGTGTGAAPVVAEIARDLGILTVGIVTKPFAFEGRRRMEQAENGIAALREYVDSLVVIPNERIKLVSEQRITLANAFEVADDVLRQGVQSISQLIKVPGLVNLDFADVTSIMKDAGYAHMGVGRAEGKDRAELAARQAVASPLLETSIDGARGVLINITGHVGSRFRGRGQGVGNHHQRGASGRDHHLGRGLRRDAGGHPVRDGDRHRAGVGWILSGQAAGGDALVQLRPEGGQCRGKGRRHRFWRADRHFQPQKRELINARAVFRPGIFASALPAGEDFLCRGQRHGVCGRHAAWPLDLSAASGGPGRTSFWPRPKRKQKRLF